MNKREKLKNRIIELYNFRNAGASERIDLEMPAVDVENPFFKEYAIEVKQAEAKRSLDEKKYFNESDFADIERIE